MIGLPTITVLRIRDGARAGLGEQRVRAFLDRLEGGPSHGHPVGVEGLGPGHDVRAEGHLPVQEGTAAQERRRFRGRPGRGPRWSCRGRWRARARGRPRRPQGTRTPRRRRRPSSLPRAGARRCLRGWRVRASRPRCPARRAPRRGVPSPGAGLRASVPRGTPAASAATRCPRAGARPRCACRASTPGARGAPRRWSRCSPPRPRSGRRGARPSRSPSRAARRSPRRGAASMVTRHWRQLPLPPQG